MVQFMMMMIKIGVIVNINGMVDYNDDQNIDQDEDKISLACKVVGVSLFFDAVFLIYILKITFEEVNNQKYKITDKFNDHMGYILPISMILEFLAIIYLE